MPVTLPTDEARRMGPRHPSRRASEKDGVEGNYISTGTDLVLIDSPEGLALLSSIHGEAVGEKRGSGTVGVG